MSNNSQKIDKESILDKIKMCKPLSVYYPCSSYEEALETIRKDPWVYGPVLFPIIHENKDNDGKVISTSIDVYMYDGGESLVLVKEGITEEDRVWINETKNS